MWDEFDGAYGMALVFFRPYLRRRYLQRPHVRIDDFKGTNWTTLGTYGSGEDNSRDPNAIRSIDAAGTIYVMDTRQLPPGPHRRYERHQLDRGYDRRRIRRQSVRTVFNGGGLRHLRLDLLRRYR